MTQSYFAVSSVLRGRKAKANGSNFERMFELQCKAEGITATKIPDGCRTIGPKKIVRTKTPFDWILSLGRAAALIDTKSTQSNVFAHSLIDPSQVAAMGAHRELVTGYVIRFQKLNRMIFAPSQLLTQCMGSRGSINTLTPGTKDLGRCMDMWNGANIRNVFQ